MSGGYEIFALMMRYVFVALGALILLRAFLWLRRDAGMYRREIRNLPDAGLVGELVDMHTGEKHPLCREGVLGASRSCDVRIKGAGLDRRALSFRFTEGKGLAVTPRGRQNVYLDGEHVRQTGYALHGTQLDVGGVTLRVRLFAGLQVPRRVLYDEDGTAITDGETEVSPFEEVAGMFAQGPDTEEMYAPDDGDNPFREFAPVQDMYEQPVYQPMPQDGYMNQGYQSAPQDGYVNQGYQVAPQDGYMNQPYQPTPQDGYMDQGYQPAPQDGYMNQGYRQAPQPENDPAPVRHRRGDRYL
ncbi:MAG: hypothetical protein E7326_07900 [Clostridiales bacterium]|nr:hypothetical protein [Clostridiales bacterium]